MKRPSNAENVQRETTEVGRDARCVFTNADSAWPAVHHPGTDDDKESVAKVPLIIGASGVSAFEYLAAVKRASTRLAV